MEDIHYLVTSGHDIALTKNASFWLGKGEVLATSSTPPGATPSLLKRPQWQSGRNGIMPWGEDNNFPQTIIDLYNQDPIIPKTLGNQAAMLMGRGIMPVQQTLGPDGKEINTPINDPEIWAFLRSPGVRQYLRQGSSDLLWFFNVFPEFILSKNRKQIVQLTAKQAAYSRYSAVNQEGRCEKVFLSANWPSASITDEFTTGVSTLDPLNWDRVNWTRNHADYKFIYPLSYPTPGKSFYSLAHHDSIRTSNWLDVHLAIPQFKKFLMQNQMSIKYHIKVDKEFWPELKGRKVWDNATAEQQLAWKKEWLLSVEKNLTDVTKTGNSIMTETTFDQQKGVMIDHIQIVPVTDLMKDGKFIDDSMEAAAKIFYALGTDPTLPGFASDKMGGNMGGSSKREAWLIALALMNPYRDLMLEPLDFISEFNGWSARYDNLTYLFRDTVLTTLDQGKGTQKVVS
ncbi:hypothetical protein [Spirosoma litoris]